MITKKINKLTFLLLILISISNYTYSQVTVGGGVPALSFVTLQLEGTVGGMRFPYVDNDADKDALTAAATNSGESSGGLIIFNAKSGENYLEYWDAINKVWVKMDASLYGVYGHNGITGTNALKLGGSLSNPTSIAQNNKDLLLKTTGTTGELILQTDALVAKNNIIGMGTATPTAGVKLHIDVADKTSSTDRFRLEDSSDDVTGKVLTSNSTGEVTWTDLKSEKPITIKSTDFLASTEIKYADQNNGVPISKAIELTKGKWLIIARISTTGSSTTLQGGHLMYCRLQGGATATNTPYIYQWMGSRTQAYSHGALNGWGTPQMFEIVDVTASQYFIRLYMSSSTLGFTQPTYHGGAYFYAIKLS